MSAALTLEQFTNAELKDKMKSDKNLTSSYNKGDEIIKPLHSEHTLKARTTNERERERERDRVC